MHHHDYSFQVTVRYAAKLRKHKQTQDGNFFHWVTEKRILCESGRPDIHAESFAVEDERMVRNLSREMIFAFDGLKGGGFQGENYQIEVCKIIRHHGHAGTPDASGSSHFLTLLS